MSELTSVTGELIRKRGHETNPLPTRLPSPKGDGQRPKHNLTEPTPNARQRKNIETDVLFGLNHGKLAHRSRRNGATDTNPMSVNNSKQNSPKVSFKEFNFSTSSSMVGINHERKNHNGQFTDHLKQKSLRSIDGKNEPTPIKTQRPDPNMYRRPSAYLTVNHHNQ